MDELARSLELMLETFDGPYLTLQSPDDNFIISTKALLTLVREHQSMVKALKAAQTGNKN